MRFSALNAADVEAVPASAAGFIAPMLARPYRRPPTGAGWAFEFKWDGVRCIARWDGGGLTLWARRGTDVTPRYPELQTAAETMFGDRAAVIDGEIIALGDDDRPSFSRLQRRMHIADPTRAKRLSRQAPVWFMAFDVLWLDGEPTLPLPYARRREMLAGLGLSEAQWQTPPHRVGDGGAMLRGARDLGLEGIVAKRLDSPYLPGARSDLWRKVRLELRQEFVVGGWTPGKGARTGGVGALLLGYYRGDALRYAGLVGTGFDHAAQRLLLSELRPRQRDASPFADPIPRRDATFVEPSMVVEVKFSEWTPDDILRHAAYLGLRGDKTPRDVVRET